MPARGWCPLEARIDDHDVCPSPRVLEGARLHAEVAVDDSLLRTAKDETRVPGVGGVVYVASRSLCCSCCVLRLRI